MPIYEYTCPHCGKEFEELVMKQNESVRCPECGSDKAHKLMSRCRAQIAGEAGLAAGGSAGGGCSSCGGGSCATCG
jgi:putative FmdB family regulatory protein